MRVLLDENLPQDLIEALRPHEVTTVQKLGWAGLKNGALLRRARGRIDAFVTMDRHLRHQQDLSSLPYAVVLVLARSNRLQDISPLVPALLAMLTSVQPGTMQTVGTQ